MVTRSDDQGSAIWVLEMTRGTATPLVSPGTLPVWSPDGQQIVFSAVPRKGNPTRHLWTIPADGSGPMVPLIETKYQLRALGWSPDGARLAFAVGGMEGGQFRSHILIMDAGGGSVVTVVEAGAVT